MELAESNNLNLFEEQYLYDMVEVFRDIQTTGERCGIEMNNYIKIQSGFSSYDLLSYLYPGSYIYIESVQNDEDESKDYAVNWIAGFGDSSKSKSENPQKYKVFISFKDINYPTEYPKIKFVDKNIPDLPYIKKDNSIDEEKFTIFKDWKKWNNNMFVQLILYVILLDIKLGPAHNPLYKIIEDKFC